VAVFRFYSLKTAPLINPIITQVILVVAFFLYLCVPTYSLMLRTELPSLGINPKACKLRKAKMTQCDASTSKNNKRDKRF